jgi:hypothetical protein
MKNNDLKDIDLTDDYIFKNKKYDSTINSIDLINNNVEIESVNYFSEKYSIIDIVSRPDCNNYYDYHRIVYDILKIDDPDTGFEVYRQGYFCETCETNLYKTNRVIECKKCFESRMFEENKLHLIN